MCWLSHTDVLSFYYLLVFNLHSFFRNLKKALETLITWSIMKISEVDNTFILIDIIHGHAISRKKRRHIRHFVATVRPRISAPHFFTIEDVSLLEKLNHETETK